jgi:hypothetical protein
MSRIDFDAIAEAISPAQFAQAIGARPNGRAFHCPSPTHAGGDKNPSLSINRKDGRTVAYCHSCGLKGTPVQVLAEVCGLALGDAAERLAALAGVTSSATTMVSKRNGLGKEVASYPYTDEAGVLLYEVVRFAFPKTFRPRLPDGTLALPKSVRRVLFRLPEVIAGVEANRHILVVEGEKDADELARRGFVGTTCPGGVGKGKWKSEFSEILRGARVVILPDNDEPGREHGQTIAQALEGIASEVRVLDLPDLPAKGDVSDWFKSGGTDDELNALVMSAPMWEPLGNSARPSDDLAEPYEWPEHPHLPGPPEPEPFPLDALPPVLRDLVHKVHLSLQVPVELPATLALAVLSASVGGKLVVEVGGTGWSEPVVLYTVVILPPASRKSPVFKIMVRPVKEWEKEEVKKAAPTMLAAQDVVEVRAKKLKDTKAAVSNGKANLDEVEAARLALSKAEDDVPTDTRLLAGDITTEEMVKRLAAQGGRMAILEPEGGPLRGFEKYTDGGAHLEEIKKCWSGETIRVDRVSRQRVFVEHPALTLGLTMQPGVLESLRNARAFRGEGVLGRILFTMPPHGLGSRLTGPDVPLLPPEAEAAYSNMVRRLLCAPPKDVDEDGFQIPHRLQLTHEALDVLYAYQSEVELELADGARFSGIRDWAGKIVGQSIRIAALLELALRAENGEELWAAPISKWAMESGVRLGRMFSSHVLVVFGEMEMDDRLLMASRVLRKSREAPITLADLWRSMRNTKGLESVEALHDVVNDLQERGCIRLVQASSGSGRPPSPQIELHPELRAPTPDRHPLNALKGKKGAGGSPKDADEGTLVDKVDVYPDEPEPAENPTFDLLTGEVV